jgi:corrinoid protein of di/trimethylamine methyltransferase
MIGMGNKEILDKLGKAVLKHDKAGAVAAANEAVAAKIDPVEAIQNGLMVGIKEVGDKFGRFEYPLPYVLLSSQAMQMAIDIIMKSAPKGTARVAKGKVVLGVAYGDIHCIGKDLVKTFLGINGYDVYDLGTEVPTEKFINKAEEVKADIIGISAMMTASMSYQGDVVNKLKARGIREKYKVLVGGCPMTPAFAESIGADDWGADMADAVVKADRMMKEK